MSAPDDVGFPRPFGNYTLLAPFASGGMGEIFLARVGSLEGASRLCLLKTMRSDVAREKGSIDRFMDEARVAMQLQHAGICQVFDCGTKDGTPYIAMELVRGTDLRSLLDELGDRNLAIPQGAALYIACEILEALDFAHRHVDPGTGKSLAVVHRDVSPHNVLLSFEGEVKLIDFGLAQSALKESHTESQVVLGKVSYMAPEHARGDPTDARADQFSAAVLTYELLANDRYYGELSSYDVWQIVGRGGHVPRRWKDLDETWRTLLKPALAANPKERYASCGELARRLRAELALRHPQVTRAALGDLLRRELKGPMQELQDRIGRAVAKAPNPNETLMMMNPLAGDTVDVSFDRTADGARRPDVDTGRTQTHLLSRSRKMKRRRTRHAVAAAGIVSVALVLVAGLWAYERAGVQGDRIATDAASVPAVPPPPEPAVVATEPVPSVPVAGEDVAPAAASHGSTRSPPASVARPRPQRNLTQAQKVDRIFKSGSGNVCAKVLRREAQEKRAHTPAIVDECFRKIFER